MRSVTRGMIVCSMIKGARKEKIAKTKHQQTNEAKFIPISLASDQNHNHIKHIIPTVTSHTELVVVVDLPLSLMLLLVFCG